MVKEAVQQLKSVTSENKEHRQTVAASTTGQRAATISGLREEAANFAKLQERVKSEEKSYAGREHITLVYCVFTFTVSIPTETRFEKECSKFYELPKTHYSVDFRPNIYWACWHFLLFYYTVLEFVFSVVPVFLFSLFLSLFG